MWAMVNDLRHFLPRLDDPAGFVQDENQVVFYRLLDADYQMRNRIGPYAYYIIGHQDERQVYRLVKQYVTRSANVHELNPAKDADAQRLVDRHNRLLIAEQIYTGAGAKADQNFVVDLYALVEADWATLWKRPDPFPAGAREQAFRRLIGDLLDILDWICRGKYSPADHNKERWQRVGEFDIDDTAVGRLRIRLFKLFQIMETITDPARMVSYAASADRARKEERL
jgi:hypothetical protein